MTFSSNPINLTNKFICSSSDERMIQYQNKGHLLIVIDDNALSLIEPSWVTYFSKLPNVSFLTITTYADQGLRKIPYLSSFDIYQSEPHVKITGSLGTFVVHLSKASQPVFDMILDLTLDGVMPQLIAMAGYYPLIKQNQPITPWLSQAEALLGSYEKPEYIQINRKICAHSSSGLIGCNHCVTACPAGAISSQKINSSSEYQIVVDTKLCQGIGSCLIACPTGALDYSIPYHKDYRHYIKNIFSHNKMDNNQTVILFYSTSNLDENQLQQQEEWLIKLPSSIFALELEELASLGIEHWIETLYDGASQLLILTNETITEPVLTLLESQLQLFNLLISDLNHTKQGSKVIQLLDIKTDIAQSDLILTPFFNHLDLVDQTLITTLEDRSFLNGTDYQKRAHLTRLLTLLWQEFSASLSTASSRSNDILMLSPNKLIASSQLPEESGFPFGQVICNSKGCTHCMGCVQVCPTHSLRALNSESEEEYQSLTLTFTEENCVQCGLCVQACPEKVLSLNARYLWDPKLRATPQTLSEQRLANCIVCNKPFAPEILIKLLISKLTENTHFQEENISRLSMCEDCRVKDQVNLFAVDPESQLKI